MSALISNILRLDSQRGVSPKLNCRSHNNKIRKKKGKLSGRQMQMSSIKIAFAVRIYSYLGELIIASPKEVKEREL
jgi:hypothetical protein